MVTSASIYHGWYTMNVIKNVIKIVIRCNMNNIISYLWSNFKSNVTHHVLRQDKERN